MLDIRFVREHADEVKENIRKKFQDKKLPLVDEVIELDKRIRELKVQGDELRQERNATSDAIGALFREKKVDEANLKKVRVVEINDALTGIEKEEAELSVTLEEVCKDYEKWFDNQTIEVNSRLFWAVVYILSLKMTLTKCKIEDNYSDLFPIKTNDDISVWVKENKNLVK